MDASNLLKPMLSSGDIRCMGSTTYQEYRGIFEKDRALSRRFQKIDIVEPDVHDTYQILKGLKSRFEDHYQIRFTDKALRSASELAEKYITDRFMPDKAIDVIDEAGAAQQLLPPSRRKKSISAHDVEQVVAKIARIPSSQVSTSDKAALMDLDKKLKMVVFGQDEAIEQLASSIKLSRAGLKSGEKPIGSFLFAGPTGVGKTEVCRQLALIMGGFPVAIATTSDSYWLAYGSLPQRDFRLISTLSQAAPAVSQAASAVSQAAPAALI